MKKETAISNAELFLNMARANEVTSPAKAQYHATLAQVYATIAVYYQGEHRE